MKKNVLLAMAVIMLLGSIKALAVEDEDDAYNENQRTKIEAAQKYMREQEEEKEKEVDDAVDHANGTVTAVQIRDIEQVNADIDSLIDRVGTKDSGLQEIQDNGLGQLSSLAEDYEKRAKAAIDDSDEVNSIWEQAMDLKVQVSKIKARIK